MKYCICASGNLGLIVLKQLVEKGIDIACVFTNKHSDEIVDYAEEVGLKAFVGNPREGKGLAWIKENGVEFDNILSINYLFILEGDILRQAKNAAVNFHGSLLPRYRGRTPHVWAIINGEKEAGITAHLMNEECDDGDIVKQLVVPIEYEDTGADVLAKYNAIYPGLVMSVVEDLEAGELKHTKQDVTKATYFGKRTPEDGEINWDWQKERIRNWVRAQANPYPGAFTFINGHKIIINKVTFVDKGFIDTMSNGLVVDIENNTPFIKTQNGVIALVDYKTDVLLAAGDILGSNGVDNQPMRPVGGYNT